MEHTTKVVMVEHEHIESYECDYCKKIIDYEDIFEFQEMLHWSMTGGYGSIFGDGSTFGLDLCQECTKEVLGDFIQYVDEELEP